MTAKNNVTVHCCSLRVKIVVKIGTKSVSIVFDNINYMYTTLKQFMLTIGFISKLFHIYKKISNKTTGQKAK